MPTGIAESCEGLAVRLSSRPLLSLARCARVCHNALPSGTAMAFGHPAKSGGESLMMISPIIANATLYRETKLTRPSTLYRHTIVYGPTLAMRCGSRRFPKDIQFPLHFLPTLLSVTPHPSTSPASKYLPLPHLSPSVQSGDKSRRPTVEIENCILLKNDGNPISLQERDCKETTYP